MEKIDTKNKIQKKGKQSINSADERLSRLEKNQEFVIVKEEEKYEPEIKFIGLLPDFKEEEEEDPLRIDNILPEVNVNPENGSEWSERILWFANRRKELLKKNSKLSFSETTKILKEEWEKDKSTFREQATMSNEPTNRQEEQKHYVGRVTAYTLWCRDVRSEFQNNHPGMSFGKISTNLGKMWKSLKPVERYNYQRRAKRVNQIKSKALNPKEREENFFDPKVTSSIESLPQSNENIKTSRKGRIIVKPTKLVDFCKIVVNRETKKRSTDQEEK